MTLHNANLHENRGSFGTTTVNIIVGPEQQIFILHKDLLCETSSYFQAALNGSFLEAKTQEIRLEKEDVTVFKHFQYWLYSRAILMTETSTNDIEWIVLVDLYVLGETRGIPQLQNDAIDGFISKYATLRWTPLDQICRIYENTPENSPLRRLLVDWSVSHCNLDDDSWFSDKTFAFFNKESLFDLSKALYQLKCNLRTKVIDFGAIRKDYHVSASI